LGSLPVTKLPFVRMPLPASANHCQSFPVWAPYFAIEKLASLLRLAGTFATQPIIGTVSIGWADAARLAATKLSPRSPATALGSPMLSKYQSLPRLSAFRRQL
jgi:hypothetical protein